MNPPQVLLEHSFLHAVAVPGDPRHEDAVAHYLTLVEQYEAEQILLVAVSDHLSPYRDRGRTGPLAPVDALYVGAQHRRAARQMVYAPDVEVALTLVMCERHKVRRIATFDPRFDAYDLVVVVQTERAAG